MKRTGVTPVKGYNMATWVTHLMIADRFLEAFPSVNRRGFCVGSIAPDCNIENEDWTTFTPPREITHWMGTSCKTAADCDRFFTEYFAPRLEKISFCEEYAFYLGYYAHLIEDAEFQRCIRDEQRVRAAWQRIKSDPVLHCRASGLPETWDSVKRLIPKEERMRDIEAIEAEYLSSHPSSGYLTEILPLASFPDYIDYLPAGCIVRKIGVMGTIPHTPAQPPKFIAMSESEYNSFLTSAYSLIVAAFKEKHLI